MSIKSIKKYQISPLALSIGAALISVAPVALSEILQLEEIVVTAQKRSQSLQDVPMSVSALSSDTLKNAGIQSIEDVKHAVPGLNIYSSNTPAQSSIAIRGAGTSAADPTLEPSVGVFVDGVFMPRSIFGLSDLVDIDRVEVLYGPQGTLYGKNTNSGVISVHTKGRPDEFDFIAEQTFGSEGLVDGQVALGGVISDDLAYRFSARSKRRDGILDDELGRYESNNIDKQSYRGQVFWDPSERLSTRAIAYYSLSDSNQSAAENYIPEGSAYNAYLNAVLGDSAPIGDPNDRQVSLTDNSGGRVEVQGASFQTEYEFDNGNILTSISAYQEWEQDNAFTDNDGSVLDTSGSVSDFNEESIAQEFRLTSPGGETVDWLAGFFYFKSDLEGGSLSEPFSVSPDGLPGIPSPFPLDGFGLDLWVPGDNFAWHQAIKSESFATFAQATWNVSEETSITAGIRYSTEDKSISVFSDSFDADGTPFRVSNVVNGTYTGGTFMPFVSGQVAEDGAVNEEGNRSEADVTGMLSINRFIGDQMIYATVATGSKSGGFNGAFGSISINDREYETEETINYEVGAKMDLMDGRARVNLAYFYTEYTDFQATTFDATTVALGIINAGRQVTQGVDVDATYLASKNLTLSLKLEYLDGRYKDFTGANCHSTSGETFNSDGECVLDDERMEFAPNWNGSIAADYVYPMNNGEIYARGDYIFKSDYISDPTRIESSVDTQYELLNGRIGWRDDHWDITLWGKNITDESYAVASTANLVGNLFGVADGGLSGSSYRRWLNDPRTWGVSVSYSM